ncbi:hypothetical protein ACIA8E_16285 [Streptomyces sp. NPDC051664]|uniref:hypothetical protein n=1 Tax=Streptomyces sp. NPDC051664 TaxID=3365668 RepID=UPI0037A317BC
MTGRRSGSIRRSQVDLRRRPGCAVPVVPPVAAVGSGSASGSGDRAERRAAGPTAGRPGGADKGVRRGTAGGPRMSRARRLLAGLLAAGALLTATAGCAQSVDPIERLGRKAAQKVQGPHRVPAAGPGGTSESGPKAGARGDRGAPGSWAVTACGRREQSQEPADSRPSPPQRQRHRWPDRPESYGAVDPGAGCERR